jgi:aspartate-semialdehyde dehydrogenase
LKDVPLVVAGVNDEDVAGHRGLIANPNCSTAQLMPVLKALHARAGLKRVTIATYQSVSGAGQAGVDELHRQSATEATENGQKTQKGAEVFARPIAYNIIPQVFSNLFSRLKIRSKNNKINKIIKK